MRRETAERIYRAVVCRRHLSNLELWAMLIVIICCWWATWAVYGAIQEHRERPIEEVLCVSESGHKRVPCK